MLTTAQTQLVALIDPAARAVEARKLATLLGADDLIVFIEDEEVQALLPAEGFPQTLREGRRWRALLASARSGGRASETLPVPGHESPRSVVGIAASDGSVLALIGGTLDGGEVDGVMSLLPLLTRSLRSEHASAAAAGRAESARTAASQAHALAEKLSATRRELQAALAAAEAAGRAKDDFLAVVSHELRTPLNAILGWAQLILMGRLDEKTEQKALLSIERNAKSQARLIADILDISRIVAGRFRLNVVQVDLTQVVEAALDVVRPAAEAKQVKLHAVLDSQLDPILGDPDRLQQILWNLLSNSVTHTPGGGCIYVRLQRVNSHVEVSVSDSGSGIAPDFLPHVFDRFRQEENSATRRHSGLGLGLAITRHLVELHGGSIAAASGGQGRGATFTVTLPTTAIASSGREAAAPRLVTPAESTRRELASLDGVRVLVVDDEAEVRDLLGTLLRQCGAGVTAVRSAFEALESLGAMQPDIIISDIEMPAEDGYSLMRKIRAGAVGPARALPAIALSAYAGPGDRMRALEAGFQLHVAKPVEPAELVAVISNLVRK